MWMPEDAGPTVQRDLDAVDAALASDAANHDDPTARELQELALALRADAPAPEPGFEERLRAGVEAGFPRRRRFIRARQAGERLKTRGRALPALAVGAGVLLALAVVIALDGAPDRQDGPGGGGSVARERAEGSAGRVPAPAPTDGRAADSRFAPFAAAPATAPGADFEPAERRRKIERSFSLELEVPLEDMTGVADRVTEVTNRNGGFVLSSSVDTGADGGGGDFELRIPSERVRPALRDLAQLAPVVRQTQDGRDVTRRHVTATDRLQAARAERRSLLRRLEDADTDEEAEALRRRLDLVAGEIRGLRAELRDLRLRTDYAAVTVSLLVDDGSPATEGGGVGGSFDDAVGDAGDLLLGVLGVVIRALAVALPLGLIALPAWAAARVLRRRRRESALV